MQAILAVTCKPEAPFDLMSMLSEVVSAAKQVLKADRGSVWLPVASSMAGKFCGDTDRPSRRSRCRPRPSLTPPCGTTAVGSSGTIHRTAQAWVMRGRNKG